MSVQRYTTADGKVRYRARVKHHGREVATRVFDRKREAEAWEEDQKRRLRMGDRFDPRRGRAALSVVAADWLESRQTIKRNSLALEVGAWTRNIEPRFGKVRVASITTADVSTWVGRLVAGGRVTVNVAAPVRPPTAGSVNREGQYLTREEFDALVDACTGKYADVVRVLALARLRGGELAGLKVGDWVKVPGEGSRLQRSVMSSRQGRVVRRHVEEQALPDGSPRGAAT